MLSRRDALKSILLAGVAPFFVPSSSLMRIKPFIVPEKFVELNTIFDPKILAEGLMALREYQVLPRVIHRDLSAITPKMLMEGAATYARTSTS